MKHIITIALLSVLPVMAKAQWRPIPLNPAENYELSVDKATMVIDAANGARITSLKYDSQEVLSQNKMPNMYGSTFWTSPQKEWNWPPVREHDIMRYDVEKTDSGIVMTSQLSEKIPLRISKRFTTDADDHCFVITYSIRNEGAEPRSVAPWEITRVPAEGTITFDAPVDSIWPAGLMNFKSVNGIATYSIDQSEKQRKINADGKGWLSYEHNGLRLTKRFPDLNAGQPAPGEDEIQVYVHNGKVYVELEAQGAYTLLHPKESLDWTVRWYLSKE